MEPGEGNEQSSDGQKHPNRRRGQEIVEHLRKASGGDNQLTTEEVMRLTRGEDWGTGRLEEEDSYPVDLDDVLKDLREE